jgi:hypothetical protein
MRKYHRFLPGVDSLEGRIALNGSVGDVVQSGDFEGQFGDQTTPDAPTAAVPNDGPTDSTAANDGPADTAPAGSVVTPAVATQQRHAVVLHSGTSAQHHPTGGGHHTGGGHQTGGGHRHH